MNTSYDPDVEYVDGDRMSQMLERLEEFDQKGVPHIWLIDPRLELTRAEIFQQ